jgi:hypothetical protein
LHIAPVVAKNATTELFGKIELFGPPEIPGN